MAEGGQGATLVLGVVSLQGAPSARPRFQRLVAQHAGGEQRVSILLETDSACIGLANPIEQYSVARGADAAIAAVAGEMAVEGRRGADAIGGSVEPAGLSSAEGSFVALRYDAVAERGWIATDRHGYAPLYYCIEDRSLAFSGNATFLARSASRHPAPSPVAFAAMLAFGQVFGEHSLYEGIRLLGPGQSILIGPEGIRVVDGETFAYDESGKTCTPEELAGLFAESIRDLDAAGVRSAGYAVPLSGGLDSRTIAASLAGAAAETFSFGSPRSGDVLIGSATARALGLPHRSFRLDPSGLAASLDSVIDATSGELNAIHSHGYTTYGAFSRPGWVLLSGFAGDLTIGGSYASVSPNGLPDVIRHMRGGISPDLLDDLLTEDGHAALAQVEDELHRSYDALPEERLENRVDHFALLTRVRRFTAGGLRLIGDRLPYRLPFFGKAFFDRTLSLPPEQRMDSRLYLEMQRRCFPEVAGLPWQRTGEPPAGGTWLPLFGQGIRIPRVSTPIRLRKWYARPFIDYDEWFRGPLAGLLEETLRPQRLAETGLLRADRLAALRGSLHLLPAQQASLLLTLEKVLAGPVATLEGPSEPPAYSYESTPESDADRPPDYRHAG